MIRKCFFAGLAILLPIALTAIILLFLINLLTTPFTALFGPTMHLLGLQLDKGWELLLSKVVILILLTVVLAVVGLLTRLYLFHRIFILAEKLFLSIPLIRTIYKAAREVLQTLLNQENPTFKQVVLVPFPHKQSLSVALLVSEGAIEGRPELLSVFLPATPNPTMGFFLLFDKSEVTYTDLKIDDALKFIVSCGVVWNPPKQTP